MEKKKEMISNMEIFLNFLAENFSLTKYIIAYTKRYNICHTPFYTIVKSKAKTNPKGLFSDVLGSGHKFHKLEEKWIEYVENSINYIPEKGDYIYAAYFDETTCVLISWVSQFDNGDKKEYTDTNGNFHNKQTFVRKATNIEIENFIH